MGMKDLVEALRVRRQRALAMGGPEPIAKQHGEGMLTVRERVDRLFDSLWWTRATARMRRSGPPRCRDVCAVAIPT